MAKNKRKLRHFMDEENRHFKVRAFTREVFKIPKSNYTYISTDPLKLNDKIPGTGYFMHFQRDGLEGLKAFKNHRRLSVFYNKGAACAYSGCKCVGTQLIAGKDKFGSIHWDVYTKDYILMTVDHIVPVSKGGGEELENKQPMCCFHNQQKGDKI